MDIAEIMKRHYLILIFILLVGLFFRSYQIVERFEFAHDGDLYSWIVKDIVVNHHIRLIGQLTSAPGIFIGPAFYYLLVPFFILTKMDPIGTIYFSIIIGLVTMFSLYFVLSKLFKTEVGLIGAFLYAVLLSTVNTDRWVVPTITTNLWVAWYFYTVIKISRGDYKILPLLGILIALIWHIHIALIPTLIAVPAAILFAKKIPNLKQITHFFITFFVTSLPLIVFEVKEGFGQTFSLIDNFTATRDGATGLYKLTSVLNMVSKNITALFFKPQSFNPTFNTIFVVIILLTSFWLIKKKVLLKKELAVFFIWIAGVIAFFGFSSSPISEYYFSNIEIVFLCLVSLVFYILFKSSSIGKVLSIGILILILLKNSYFMITQDYYHKGYVEKKAVVDYITNDARIKNLPCFSINYITAPGENAGFRYFFYLKNAKLAVAGRGSPVYNIVIPDEYALNEVKIKFGHIGIIPPKEIGPNETIKEACSGQNTNLTEPLFGYVE